MSHRVESNSEVVCARKDFEKVEFRGKDVSDGDEAKTKQLSKRLSLNALDLSSTTPLDPAERAVTTIEKVEMKDARCISIKNGGTLKTFLARHKDWGPVVYKQLMVSVISDEDRVLLSEEAKFQLQLNHPSIERFVGMVFEPGQCGLVMEYLKYGNIQEFSSDFQVDWGWKLQMCFDIVLGMNYLHAQTPSIVHGHLSAQNVLIGNGFKAKISNFGFHHFKQYAESICQLESHSDNSEENPQHMVTLAGADKDAKDDVLEFGVLFREIVTQGRSEYGRNDPGCIPEYFVQLIGECCDENADKRPSFSDLRDRFEKLCTQHQDPISKAKKSLNQQEKNKNELQTGSSRIASSGPPHDISGPLSESAVGGSRDSTASSRTTFSNSFHNGMEHMSREGSYSLMGATSYGDWFNSRNSNAWVESRERVPMIRKPIVVANMHTTEIKYARMDHDMESDVIRGMPSNGSEEQTTDRGMPGRKKVESDADPMDRSPAREEEPTSNGQLKMTNTEIKTLVTRNYVSVLRYADRDVESIADYLWQEGILTDEPLQIIESKLSTTSKRDSCRFLLDKLLSSGNPDAFVTFLEALEKHIPYLATAIKNTKPSEELIDGNLKQLNRQMKYRVVDHYRDLVHNINPEDVLDLLFQEGIITLEEKTTLMLGNRSKTQQKKCRALLDNLLYAQNERTFVVFKRALSENGYKWLVKKLDEEQTVPL